MKKVKSLRMKNELFYSLKKLKGILNYIIIITGDTVKCGVNIVIYATHTLIICLPMDGHICLSMDGHPCLPMDGHPCLSNPCGELTEHNPCMDGHP